MPEESDKFGKNRWYILGILILLLILIITWNYLKAKYPQLFGATSTAQLVSNKNLALIRNFILIAIGIIIAYFIYKGFQPKAEGIKKPVIMDLAKKLAIERLSKEQNIICIEKLLSYPKKKYKLWLPVNEDAIRIKDERFWQDKHTSFDFLLMEIIMTEGKDRGIHRIVIPLDLGEDEIRYGKRIMEYNKIFDNFELKSRTYPLITPQDAKDRKELAIIESLEPEEAQSYLKRQPIEPQPQLERPYKQPQPATQ